MHFSPALERNPCAMYVPASRFGRYTCWHSLIPPAEPPHGTLHVKLDHKINSDCDGALAQHRLMQRKYSNPSSRRSSHGMAFARLGYPICRCANGSTHFAPWMGLTFHLLGEGSRAANVSSVETATPPGWIQKWTICSRQIELTALPPRE